MVPKEKRGKETKKWRMTKSKMHFRLIPATKAQGLLPGDKFTAMGPDKQDNSCSSLNQQFSPTPALQNAKEGQKPNHLTQINFLERLLSELKAHVCTQHPETWPSCCSMLSDMDIPKPPHIAHCADLALLGADTQREVPALRQMQVVNHRQKGWAERAVSPVAHYGSPSMVIFQVIISGGTKQELDMQWLGAIGVVSVFPRMINSVFKLFEWRISMGLN